MRVSKTVWIAALVLALTGVVSAVTVPSIPGGPIRFKYSNWDMGTKYTNPAEWPVDGGEAAMNALTQTPAPGAVGNEDAWFVFRVTDMWDNWQGGNNFFNDGDNGTEIVGIGFGLVDVGIGSNGSVLSVGYEIKIYAQPFGTFNELLGSGGRTGLSTYTSIGGVGSVLLWDAVSVSDPNFGLPPLESFGTPPTYEHVAASTGRSDMYLNGIGGLWGDGVLGNGELIDSTFKDFYSGLNVVQDVHIKSSVVDYIPQPGVGTDNWDFFSEDPGRGTLVVPEPVTMIGLLFGAAGVGGYLRRRLVA